MATEVIDVIDTAVKIGLGALISGITTYVVTRKSYLDELRREKLRVKIEFISSAVEGIDSYFSSFENLLSVIDGIRRTGEVKEGEELEYDWLKKRDDELVDKRPVRLNSLSKLKLVGEGKAVQALSPISSVEAEFRQKVIFEKVMLSENELNEFMHKVSDIKRDFYSSTEKSFDNIFN
jgi:hypothetical protein